MVLKEEIYLFPQASAALYPGLSGHVTLVTMQLTVAYLSQWETHLSTSHSANLFQLPPASLSSLQNPEPTKHLRSSATVS